MRATERFAINRDDPFDGFADALDPLHKTRFKLFRIKQRKDPAKRIMRGYPIDYPKQFRKKSFLRFSKLFNFNPPFCSAQHSTNRQNDDIS